MTGDEALRVIGEVSQELTNNPVTANLEGLQTRLNDVKTHFVDTIRAENGADDDDVVQEFYETQELLPLVKVLRERDSQPTNNYMRYQTTFELGNTLKKAMGKTSQADALVYLKTVAEDRIPVVKNESIENVRSAMKTLNDQLPVFALLKEEQQWRGIVENVLKIYAKAQVLYYEHDRLFWQREPLNAARVRRNKDDQRVKLVLEALQSKTYGHEEAVVLKEKKANIPEINQIVTDLFSTLYSLKREDYTELFKKWWYAQNVNLCINFVAGRGVKRSFGARGQNQYKIGTSTTVTQVSDIFKLAEKDFEQSELPPLEDLRQMSSADWSTKKLNALKSFTWLSDKVK